MPAIHRKSYQRTCCAPVYRIVTLPCRLIERVYELAKMAFYYIRYGKAHPFETTEEEKRHLQELVADLGRVEAVPAKRTLSHANFHATWEDAGKRMELSDEAKHSKEMKEFRIFAKQIITALAKQLVVNTGKVPHESSERNDIISGVGLLCDKLTQRLADRLEQPPQLAATLFDNILTYVSDEAKTHVVANKAMPNNNKDTTYRSELNAIEAKQQILNEPQKYPEKTCQEARAHLLEKAQEGSLYFLSDFYYQRFTAKLEATQDANEAHESAYKAYQNQQIILEAYFQTYAKVLGETKDAATAHAKALEDYHGKALEIRAKFAPLNDAYFLTYAKALDETKDPVKAHEKALEEYQRLALENRKTIEPLNKVYIQTYTRVVGETHNNIEAHKKALEDYYRVLGEGSKFGSLNSVYLQYFTKELKKSQNEAAAHAKTLEKYDRHMKNNAEKFALLNKVYFKTYKTVFEATNDAAVSHAKALEEYHRKTCENRAKFAEINDNFHNQCLQIYLQNQYTATYLQNSDSSKDIKQLSENMKDENKCKDVGDAERLYREHVRLLAQNLLRRLMPVIVETLAIPLISTNFFKWIVKTTFGGVEVKDSWIKTIEKLIRVLTRNPATITKLVSLKFPIEDKIISFLEKWILSNELTHQFGANIYPSIQKQLLKMMCRTIIANKIDVFAPLLFAYQATETHANEIKDALWKEMCSDERKEFSLKGDHPPYTQEAFYGVVDDLLEAFSKEQFLARKIVEKVQEPQKTILISYFSDLIEADPEKRTDLRQTIKALIANESTKAYGKLVCPPQADPDKDNKIKKQEITFAKHLDPLIEKMESYLLAKKELAPQKKLTPEEISKYLNEVIQDTPREVLQFIGDLTINIVCNFGYDKSWLTTGINYLPYISNVIKGKINNQASAILEPFRASFDEIIKSIKETLESRLKSEREPGLDIEKVYSLYFGNVDKITALEKTISEKEKNLLPHAESVSKLETERKDLELKLQKAKEDKKKDDEISLLQQQVDEKQRALDAQTPALRALQVESEGLKHQLDAVKKQNERNVNCDPELELLAKQLFEYIKMLMPPESWMSVGGLKAKFARAIATGQDSKHIKEVLQKVHRTYFGIQLINLSRLDRIFQIITTVLDAQPVQPPPALVPPPATPAAI